MLPYNVTVIGLCKSFVKLIGSSMFHYTWELARPRDLNMAGFVQPKTVYYSMQHLKQGRITKTLFFTLQVYFVTMYSLSVTV